MEKAGGMLNMMLAVYLFFYTYKNIKFHAATDIQLLVFNTFKGFCEESVMLFCVLIIQDVKEHL